MKTEFCAFVTGCALSLSFFLGCAVGARSCYSPPPENAPEPVEIERDDSNDMGRRINTFIPPSTFK